MRMLRCPSVRPSRISAIRYGRRWASARVVARAYDDVNHLQTLLNRAVAADMFEEACFIRDRIRALTESNTSSWTQLGVLEWLVDRAGDLGFSIPTPVQVGACETILQSSAISCSLHAPTGAGKTLAFLLACLSLLSYPPDTSPADLEGPQLVIVVPTRELGVQIAMIVFRLFGGSLASDGIPGNKSNMFRFNGPRGLRVKGLILEDEVDRAVEDRYLHGAHVVVGTPELISAAMDRGVNVIGPDCRAVVVDEADACFASAAINPVLDALREVGAQTDERPRLVLAGATLSQDVIDMALTNGWINSESFVQVDVCPITPCSSGEGEGDAKGKIRGEATGSPISSRLQHRYITTNKSDMLGMLCRTILVDQKSHPLDSQPTRGIVYVEDSTVARTIIEPLRAVLWYARGISFIFFPTAARSKSHPETPSLRKPPGRATTLAPCFLTEASPSKACTHFETTKQACWSPPWPPPVGLICRR